MEEALEALISSNKLGRFLLDDETKKLEAEVEDLRREDRQKRDEKKHAEEELKAREENHVNLRHYLAQIQELCRAHETQITADRDNISTDERDTLCLHQKSKEHECTLLKVEESNGRMKHLSTLKEREVEEMKEEMRDNAEMVEELVDRVKNVDEVHQLLAQYSDEDNSLIKDLLFKLERYSSEVASLESKLEAARHKELAECASQSHLAATYVSECERRNVLLLQWEEGLAKLQLKGEQHEQCLSLTLQLQDKIREAENNSNDEQKLLKQIENSKTEIIRKLRRSETNSSQIYIQLLETKTTLMEISAQTAALSMGVTKAEAEMVTMEEEIYKQEQANEEKETYLKYLNRQNEKTEQNIDLNSELLENVLASARDISLAIKKSERQYSEACRRNDIALKDHQELLKDLNNMENQKSDLEAEIASLKAFHVRTVRDSNALSAKVEKLHQLIYKKESERFKLKQQLHDLNNNEKTDEETLRKKQELSTIEEHTKTAENEVKKLEQHLLILQNQLIVSNKEINKTENRLQEVKQELSLVKMKCEAATRDSSRLNHEREELEVKVSLNKLNMYQKLKQISKIKEEVHKMVTNGQQMEQLAEEQCEIQKTKTQTFEIELKKLESELHGVNATLHTFRTKIELYRERYTTLCNDLGAKEDEDEIEIAAAKVIMKMEEEVSGLQEAGDMVEDNVREAEKDLEALNVLLNHAKLEERNMKRELYQTYRKEDENIQQMEEQIHSVQLNTDKLSKEKERIEKLLNAAQDKLHELKLQSKVVEELLAEKNCHMSSAERELAEQKIKMTHAQEATNNLMRRTRMQAMLQADVELRVIQERLKQVNHHLGRLASEHPELAASITLYCQQANIPPPKLTLLAQKMAFGSRSSTGSLSSRSSLGDDKSLASGRSSNSSRSSVASNDSGSSSILSLNYQDVQKGKRNASSRKITSTCPGEATPTVKVISADFPPTGFMTATFKGKTLKMRPH